MNSVLLFYMMLMLVGVFISSIAQVLLKKAAGKRYDSIIKQYLNFYVISAYIIFFLATFICVFAYRVVPLSMGAILEATGYIFVSLFSMTIFHEQIGLDKMFAQMLIVVGIVVYSCFG